MKRLTTRWQVNKATVKSLTLAEVLLTVLGPNQVDDTGRGDAIENASLNW